MSEYYARCSCHPTVDTGTGEMCLNCKDSVCKTRRDSGQVGWAVITENNAILVDYPYRDEEKLQAVIEAEVDQYDKYLTGQVYGYRVIRDGDCIDSCYGFYDIADARSKAWFIDGKLHRVNGPAVEDESGNKKWHYQGRYVPCCSQDEFERLIKLRALW